VSLVAAPDELVGHPRANAEVSVRALDPVEGADADAWQQVEDLQVANREQGHSEEDHRAYVRQRQADRRTRFVAGDGAWFVAELPDGTVAASCGVIVTDGRGRFQTVDTAQAHRRRGIASRLVHDAGHEAVARFGARQLVIVADAAYHALALYESLGFVRREQITGMCWWPGAPNAAHHPDRG
jgi:ribosomal protein S18 acetylase RimI-like enzyme